MDKKLHPVLATWAFDVTIYEQLIDVCAGVGDRIISGAEVIERVVARFGTKGPALPHTGLVYWGPQGTTVDLVVGEWLDGVPSYRPNAVEAAARASSRSKAAPPNEPINLGPSCEGIMGDRLVCSRA